MTDSAAPAPIRLRFAYTDSDWDDASRYFNRKSRRGLSGVLFTLLFAGMGVYELFLSFFLIQSPYLFEDGVRNLLAGVFYLGFAAIIWFDLLNLIHAWWRRRRKPPMRPPSPEYEFTFDEAGARYVLQTEWRREDIWRAWNYFTKVVETEQALFLVNREDESWLLPKQYFADEKMIDAFRDLVRRRIAKPS